MHLISPVAATGAEILLIAYYRVVSTLRKSVTMVARQTPAVLDRQGEHIADAAFALNDPRRTWIGLQLAPPHDHGRRHLAELVE